MTGALQLSSWRGGLLPLLIVAAGFLLRAAYYHEPYGHPDEVITVEVVKYLRTSGDWDTNWARANLPAKWQGDQYNFSSYLYATYGFSAATRLLPGLREWSAAADGYWAYRFLSAILGSVVIWQTWQLARRIAGDAAGVTAGALVAFAPLLVQDAHYARPEAFVTVLTLLAVQWSLFAEGRLSRLFACAVTLGVLVACKVSFVLLGWLPLLGLWPTTAVVRSRRAPGVLVSAGGLLAGFALGAPQAVLHPAAFWHGVRELAAQYAGVQPPYSPLEGGPVGGMMGAYFLATLGWPLLVVGLVGGIELARTRRWRELAALAGPVVLFTGYFATRSVFFERNLSQVLPLGCILAGLGISAVAGKLVQQKPGYLRWAVLLLVLLVLLRPASLSVRLVGAGFSRAGEGPRQELEASLRAAHPGAGWAEVSPLNDEPLAELARYFAQGGAPLVLAVRDTGDPWSTQLGRSLLGRFDAGIIATQPGLFADLPFSTLQVYVSQNWTYYLVRGAARREGGPAATAP